MTTSDGCNLQQRAQSTRQNPDLQILEVKWFPERSEQTYAFASPNPSTQVSLSEWNWWRRCAATFWTCLGSRVFLSPFPPVQLGFGWGSCVSPVQRSRTKSNISSPVNTVLKTVLASEVICMFFPPKSFGKSFSENLWQCQKWDFQHLTVERPLRRTSKNLKAGKVAGTTKSHKKFLSLKDHSPEDKTYLK